MLYQTHLCMQCCVFAFNFLDQARQICCYLHTYIADMSPFLRRDKLCITFTQYFQAKTAQIMRINKIISIIYIVEIHIIISLKIIAHSNILRLKVRLHTTYLLLKTFSCMCMSIRFEVMCILMTWFFKRRTTSDMDGTLTYTNH